MSFISGGPAAIILAGKLWHGRKDVAVMAVPEEWHFPVGFGSPTKGRSVAREVYSLASSREGGQTS